MNIQSIIEVNRNIQQDACKFNIRAGEIVFPIMSQSEWKDYLINILNNARSISEIKDLKILQLPELDSEMRTLVEVFNPFTIEVDGEILNIEYRKEYGDILYARTNVTEDFARNTSMENLSLPGGRIVEICCNSCRSNSFTKLVEQLEKIRIENCLLEVSRIYETDWSNEINTIYGWIPKVGNEIKITSTNNGNGEPINGILSLKQQYHGYNHYKMFLAKNKEEADKEIEQVVQTLQFLKKSLGKRILAIVYSIQIGL